MASKKKDDIVEALALEQDKGGTFNPLLQALRENDKRNLFKANVRTAFHKTGFHLFDYYFGSVINVHDEMGRLIRQEPRVGQAAGTFNLLVGNSGSGKALPVSTAIPTVNGIKRMGSLMIGDKIYGSNMDVVTVTGIYPQGIMQVFKVTLENKSVCFCTMDHLWSVSYTSEFTGYDKLETIRFERISDNYKNTDIFIPVINPDTKSTTLVKIVDVEYDHDEECECITVDDPYHLYLIDQFILTHNTTLASQIAANIMRQYPYSNVIHYDCENRFDISRCETITKLPMKYFDSSYGAERYMIKDGMVALDTIQEMVTQLYASKMRLKDQLIVPSGFKNEFGKDVMILQPTIIIIDSITTVLNETLNPNSTKEVNDAGQMRSNTEGARDAKTLKGFFKDILPMCKESNIIVYGINHLNQNMSMNAFLPVAKQQNYLKQDESIPGGKTMIYYPFNIAKMTAKPADDYTLETDGFNGHLVMIEPIKSSSNQSGNNSKGVSFEMVFAKEYGFDPLRTMIHYGRQRGIIEGNKTRMKFKDDPSYTFTFKDIYKEKDQHPIWEDVNKFIVPMLTEHLSFIEPDQLAFDERALMY